MVKAPRPGHVKTRLCPPLSPEDAASLAACFAQDTAAKAHSVSHSVHIVYSPADGLEELETLLSPGLFWMPQQGEGLGERMLAAMQIASTQGFSPLVMIGTDFPTLPPSRLSSAFELLNTGQADIVLGPAYDGGYYLIGLKRPVPDIFDSVAWSTPHALTDTLNNASSLGLSVVQLPMWYDVDTPDDLWRLIAELNDSQTAREYAPKTFQWLSSHADFNNHPYVK